MRIRGALAWSALPRPSLASALQITGGSGKYAGATGSLHLSGHATSDACMHGGVGALVEHFKISGSVTA